LDAILHPILHAILHAILDTISNIGSDIRGCALTRYWRPTVRGAAPDHLGCVLRWRSRQPPAARRDGAEDRRWFRGLRRPRDATCGAYGSCEDDGRIMAGRSPLPPGITFVRPRGGAQPRQNPPSSAPCIGPSRYASRGRGDTESLGALEAPSQPAKRAGHLGGGGSHPCNADLIFVAMSPCRHQ
jgi:hypothetical protein